ncbi:MAG: hypothetical protein NVS4B2_24670 [Chloroflexota bacterium]
MQVDSLGEWAALYRQAGLVDLQVRIGPFEMMTPKGFLGDEGFLQSLTIMGRVMMHPSFICKMARLMPRIRRAVPYLGYIVIAGTKPATRAV